MAGSLGQGRRTLLSFVVADNLAVPQDTILAGGEPLSSSLAIREVPGGLLKSRQGAIEYRVMRRKLADSSLIDRAGVLGSAPFNQHFGSISTVNAATGAVTRTLSTSEQSNGTGL